MLHIHKNPVLTINVFGESNAKQYADALLAAHTALVEKGETTNAAHIWSLYAAFVKG